MITPVDLDAIAAAQGDLDMIDDQLSQAIETIEKLLHDRLSIRVELEVESEPFTRVGFGKISGGWHLVVVMGGKDHSLLSAPRAIRSRALAGGHVERLVLGAATLIRSEIDGRKAAIDAANRLLHTLTNQQGA